MEQTKTFSGTMLDKFLNFLNGRIFVEKIVHKNWLFIFVLAILIFAHIANRYACIKKQKEIVSLNKQIEGLKHETLTISSMLVGKSREIKVKTLIKNSGIDLDKGKSPVYKIE